MRRILIIALLASAATLFADDVSESRRLAAEATRLRDAGDKSGYLETMRKAAALRPTHQTMLFRLAGALAVNGKTDESLDVLDSIARMGMVVPLQRNPELAELRSHPRFGTIASQFERNAAPQRKTQGHFRLGGDATINEGIAWDSKRGHFLVSSVRGGRIFVVSKRGTLPLTEPLPFAVFGLAYDSRRDRIWAAASVLPQFERFEAARDGQAALLEIDASDGRVVRTYDAPGGGHLLGDLTLDSAGQVFVSDSRSPVIFALQEGHLEPYARGAFSSLQGLASNGRYLYASDYSRGLFAVDPVTRDAVLLPVPHDTTLLGVDGMAMSDPRTIIAVQNGTAPERILRIHLSRSGLAVTRVDVLAANQPLLTSLTLGTLHGGEFFFNAKAAWDRFDDDGKPTGDAPIEPGAILSVRH